MLNSKKCLICNKGLKNDVLYWHIDKDTGSVWCWCNKCDRGYSIEQYCNAAGLDLVTFLQGDFDFKESKSNEVRKMEWPASFVSLFDYRAKEGVEYLKSRGIDPDKDLWFDLERRGIVFPYYVQSTFVGAQIRLLKEWVNKDGDARKIDTLPGTRLGLLFFGWDQRSFSTDIKGVIVTEGAFNAVSIQQSLNDMYGGVLANPWRCVAASGSGASKHQIDCLKELKENGIKIIAAPDSDEAGLKMLKKLKHHDAITHVALTNQADIDWNDAAKALGKKRFVEWFLRGIQAI